MLANMRSNNFPVLWVGVLQNILNQVIAILITGNVDQRDAGTIQATFTDTIKVTTKKVDTTNLKAFFNNLRSKLIHAVFGSVTDNMVNSPATISWCSMLADMLNTPVAELSMGNNVNAGKNFFNARTLRYN